jgi:segregation and condensation protein B
MEPEKLQLIIESALMAYAQPLDVDRLQSLFVEQSHTDDDEEEKSVADIPSKQEIEEALEAIQQNCEGRGFELKKVGSGWRFQVRAEMAPWVNKLWEEKPQRYSRALLETLSIIAYRQPITRGDIEEIRGVAVSSHIIKTLSEREWIKVVGQRDVPGRPSLYATTRQFLDYFNLESLEELPSLRELADIDSLTPELDLNPEAGSEPSAELEPSAESEPSPDSETSDSSVETSEEPADESTGEVVSVDEIIDESVAGDADHETISEDEEQNDAYEQVEGDLQEDIQNSADDVVDDVSDNTDDLESTSSHN